MSQTVTWQEEKPAPPPAPLDGIIPNLQALVANTTPADNIRSEAIPVQGWPIYLDSAHINIETYSTVKVAGLVQFVTIRYQDLQGNIFGLIANANAFTSSVNMNKAQLIIPIPSESFLLSVEFGGNTPATNLKRGQLYVQAYISFDGASDANLVLIQDYVFNGYNPTWPGPFKSTAPTEGPGYIFNVSPSNPGPGSDFAIAVPNGTRWRERAFFATLEASSAVANRSVRILLTDGTNDIWVSPPSPNQTAGINVIYAVSFADLPSETTVDSTGIIRLYVPNSLSMVPAAWVFQSLTANIQGGDQWEITSFPVEQWIDP